MQVRPSESNLRAIDLRVLRQTPHPTTAIGLWQLSQWRANAMPLRLVADENVHAGAIERRAECIGVQCLTPLACRPPDGNAAILRGGKRPG